MPGLAREIGIKAGTLMFWQKGAAKKPSAIRLLPVLEATLREREG